MIRFLLFVSHVWLTYHFLGIIEDLWKNITSAYPNGEQSLCGIQ